MKSIVRLIVFLAGSIFLVFIGGIIYLNFIAMPFFSGEVRSLCLFIMFVLVTLSLAAGIVTVCASVYLLRLRADLPLDIEKAVLLSDSNTMLREYALIGKESVLIGKGESAYIDLNEAAGEHLVGCEHAVINRVGQNLFVESVSDEFVLGLKRADGQYVYKLKSGVCYKLCINDVLYIANERLLFV